MQASSVGQLASAENTLISEGIELGSYMSSFDARGIDSGTVWQLMTRDSQLRYRLFDTTFL